MRLGLPKPGGISQQLWDACQDEALQALYHPFVVSLAAGTLPRPCFRHYVAQDTFFLHRFADAYKAALDKCRAGGHVPANAAVSVAEAEAVLQGLLDGVSEELQLHDSYAASWQVDAQQLAAPSAATRAYTDFLMHVAQDPSSSVAAILASMAPCARLYGFLGCQLVSARGEGAPRHAYSDWLDTYSSDVYLECPDKKERLLDALTQPGDFDQLLALYRRAMQLEVDFFSAQPEMPPQRTVQLLVTDFDDTCTAKDTISLLLTAAAEAGGRKAAAAGGGEAAAAGARLQVQQRAKELANNYFAAHKQLMAKILPEGQESVTAAVYQPAALRSFLEQLSQFETKMNQVVVQGGILKGLSSEDVAQAAGQVQLREGCLETLAAAAAAGVQVEVVSVNWSRQLVAAALQHAGTSSSPPRIHANELSLGPDGITSGGINLQLQHALDKECVFDHLQQQQQPGHQQQNGLSSTAAAAANGVAGVGGSSRGCSVFVGDSVSDLLALLKADYGIIIGSNQLLRRVCSTFGIQVAPLVCAPSSPGQQQPASNTSTSSSSNSQAPVLYTADSWHHIAAFLFGPPAVGSHGRLVVGAASAPAVNSSAAGLQQQQGTGSGRRAAGDMPRVLSVAGSDSGGGAGIQADLKAILAQGAFGMTAITAITAQNTCGVQAVHVVPPEVLAAQLDSVLGDLGADVVKTGMLADAATVELVASKVRQYAVPQLVVDPVMVATSGHSLAASEVVAALQQHLLPLATLVTPNLVEAAALLGGVEPIQTLEDMRAAAKQLHALGPRYVLVKGGHLLELQQQQQQQQTAAGAASHPQQLPAVDILYGGHTFWELSSNSVTTRNLHGTGCTLAASIAAQLSLGKPMLAAVAAAKGYLTSVLGGSASLSLGSGRQRPFHHGADLFRSLTPSAAVAVRSYATTTSTSTSTGAPADAAADSSTDSSLQQQQLVASRDLVPCDLRLYVVTDAGCNHKAGRTLEEAVAAAVAGGATIVQLREKNVDGSPFLQAAAAVVRVCRPLGVPVIINDRVDVALAVDADGVHVGQSDMPAAVVRRLLGPHKIVGVSVKTPAQAVQAVQDGADYLGCGAVYPTGTKDSDVIGLQGLAAVCEAAGKVPVVSIGGVGSSNAAETIAAGAAGIAVVSAVFAAPDARAAAAQLRQAVDSAMGAAAPAAAAAAAAPAGRQ